MKISIVIPCYRSEHTISNVVERTERVLENNPGYDYEIICVNDCSPDGTLGVLHSLAAKNEKVKVLDLARNFGQHSALMAGFNYVTGDVVVCLDDDGQTAPEDMFKLIAKIEEGYDVSSARYVQEHRPLLRKLGSKVSMAMSHWLVGMPKNIELNSFCAFRRFVSDEVIKYKNAYPFVHGLMLRATRNIANVEMVRNDRESGSSGYTLGKLFALWLNGFTAFSVAPLRLAGVVGAFVAFVGFAYGAFIIIRKLIVPEISAGYSSIMAVILFFAGINMLFLGLIGEYIGRSYICINDAPQFVIRERTNIDVQDERQ